MSEEGRGGEPEGFERDTVGARGCVFGTLKGFLNFSGVKRVGEGVKRGVSVSSRDCVCGARLFVVKSEKLSVLSVCRVCVFVVLATLSVCRVCVFVALACPCSLSLPFNFAFFSLSSILLSLLLL